MANQKTKKTTKSTPKSTKSPKTTKATKTTKPAKTAKPAKQDHTMAIIISVVVAVLAVAAIVVGLVLIINKVSRSKRVGTYEISSLYLNGEEENSVDLLKALGLTASIELRDDNTCTVNLFGEQNECTYTDTALHMTESDTDTPYTYQNNEITITDNGNSMTFARKTE